MATAFCLDCGYSVNLGSRPVENQMITCSNCGTQLEVLSLDPLELDWAYLEPAVDDEEWDWDWDWEEVEHDQTAAGSGATGSRHKDKKKYEGNNLKK